MLTDRQQKFSDAFSELLSPQSEAFPEEKKYLLEAKKKIDRGENFRTSIEPLLRALCALDSGKLQVGGLSGDVKSLYLELVATYGKPQEANNVRVIGGPAGGGRTSWSLSYAMGLLFIIICLTLLLIYMWPLK